MKIDHLRIHNYKSLVDFELIKPNPFTVFVGPNASGKSNIFEALEFLRYYLSTPNETDGAFGGIESYFNRAVAIHSQLINIPVGDGGIYSYWEKDIKENLEFTVNNTALSVHPFVLAREHSSNNLNDNLEELRREILSKLSRIFVGKNDLVKIKNTGSEKLQIDASNLESVLKRILKNEIIQEEFIEWCELFIPEFENITVHSDNISGIDTLLVKEKFMDKPLTKNLLSDGTLNILALLTAIYQSDEPQFLCIEEPENGLNPFVIKELVNFFRNICKEKGHMIWLNTHSQTLVRHLEPHEIILIDKKEGITQPKQVLNFQLEGLMMDEAWFSNTLGGGLPW